MIGRKEKRINKQDFFSLVEQNSTTAEKKRSPHKKIINPLHCSIFFLNLGSSSTPTWHIPRNQSRPRKFVPCRPMLQRREITAPRGSHSATFENLYHSLDRRRRLHKNQARHKHSFSSRCTFKATRATTTSQIPSELR